MLKKLLMVAVGAAFISLGVGEASYAASLSVIASGLDGPRGLTFGPDGSLYVTEAGTGGTGACIPAPGGSGLTMCYGATGAVTRIQNGKQEHVVTGLPSVAISIPQLPVSFDATGPHDIQFDSTGQAYVLVGLGSTPQQRDDVLQIPDFGQLIRIDQFDGGSSWTRLADLAAYEGLYNPDNTSVINQNTIDSNPYSFLIQGDTAYIVDAAANDLLQVKTDGSGLTALSVFPERAVTDPATGETIEMQSVPTAIAAAPDGTLYVAEFTGYPYPEKGARIFKIGPDNQPVVYADGFTQIIDIAFDDKGGLYVLEFASTSINVAISSGVVTYLAPDGTRKTIVSDGLLFPTALALGSDGDIYISNQGYLSGQGQIVRISVPEPSYTVSMLAFGVFIPASWWLRKYQSSSLV